MLTLVTPTPAVSPLAPDVVNTSPVLKVESEKVRADGEADGLVAGTAAVVGELMVADVVPVMAVMVASVGNPVPPEATVSPTDAWEKFPLIVVDPLVHVALPMKPPSLATEIVGEV